MKKIKIILILLLIITVVAACSSNKDEEEAFKTLDKGLSEITRLFHTSTTVGSEIDPAVPILNPEITDEESARIALLVYFDEKLTDKILSHYLSKEKKGDYNLLNATKEGIVVPFFGFNYSEQKSKEFFIEKEQLSYKITVPNKGVFTLAKTDKGYLITNYN